MRPSLTVLAIAVLMLAATSVGSVESDPLPVPRQNPRANAVRLYNDGVALLTQRNLAEARTRFEAALAIDDSLAEAHNNLAYVLRMQGSQNFPVSLAHYNRAISLKPALAQAYMYRGALFVQQGDMARARQDLEKLRQLNPALAADLERVVNGAADASARGGIAAQFEY